MVPYTLTTSEDGAVHPDHVGGWCRTPRPRRGMVPHTPTTSGDGAVHPDHVGDGAVHPFPRARARGKVGMGACSAILGACAAHSLPQLVGGLVHRFGSRPSRRSIVADALTNSLQPALQRVQRARWTSRSRPRSRRIAPPLNSLAIARATQCNDSRDAIGLGSVRLNTPRGCLGAPFDEETRT